MEKLLLFVGIAAACFGTPAAASGNDRDDDSSARLTIAVIGDWPYNDPLLNNANLFVDSVNADRNVALVMQETRSDVPCKIPVIVYTVYTVYTV